MCMSALSTRSRNGNVSRTTVSNSESKVKRRGAATAANTTTVLVPSNEPWRHVRRSLADQEKMAAQLQGRGIIQQRLFLIARNKEHNNGNLQERLLDIVGFCNDLRNYETDRVSGLVLNMPTHTLLVVEAGDDLLRMFCKELNAVSGDFWSAISVFHVDFHVTKVYFDTFVYKHLENMENCEQHKKSLLDILFRRQHLRLRQILHKLCAAVKHYMQNSEPTVDDKLPTKVIEHLQLDPSYLEQVLCINEFYRSLQSYVSLVHRVPFNFDDDLYDWEKPKVCFNTKDIFERSAYDVNLSFDVNNPTNY